MKAQRPVLRVVVAFVAGVFIGGCVVAILASRASRQFFLTPQLSLQAEEDREAAQAWGGGDFGAALGHAACASAAMHGSGARAFDPERANWSTGFPFAAPIIARIIEPNLTPKGQANAQAAARAKLGAIWERLGKAELAEREYREAALLFGAADPGGMHDLGKALLDRRPEKSGTGN